jgi:hypothetical protein
MAYRMKLRDDGMTKGIELRCRKQNHLSNISLWDQQIDINKKEKKREKKIKLKVKETAKYMNDITCKENGINRVT